MQIQHMTTHIGVSLPIFQHRSSLIGRPTHLRSFRLPRARTSGSHTKSSAGTTAGQISEGDSQNPEKAVAPDVKPEESGEVKKPTLWQRFKNVFLGGQLDKAKLKALGIGAFLSYGFVSNASYGACVAVAWITHVKRTGLCPLAPGQWSGFLAVYAGLFALQNFLRPMRFTVAVALTPAVNRLIEYVQTKLNVNKGQAFGILMAALAISTTLLLGFAIWILGGFPPSPPVAT